MYKQKNIACFSLFLIVSLQAWAQDGVNLKSIKKEIDKTDKLLATEFAAIKLIPGKTFIIQEYEGHDSLSFYSPEKISTDSFYISPYEVTNKQYRQFIDYVQDSIMRKLMGYVKQDKDGDEYIDYKKKINSRRMIESMEFTIDRTQQYYFDVTGSIWLNARYMVYGYKAGRKRVSIPIMPDTTFPGKDYPYSYNEPMLSNYFYHPAFDNYPVTGVSFLQAEVYCRWKTEQLKNAVGNNSEYDIVVSLPTASQWEAASVFYKEADSTLHNRQIIATNQARRYINKPVKSTAKNTIEFDCNFGVIQDANGYIIKDHGDDGGTFTMKVNAYQPNFYGLYNMKGNVAEWTTTNGDECYGKLQGYFSARTDNRQQITDSIKMINPGAVILTTPIDSFLRQMKQTKIVKGGDWMSSPFYIQPGVNQFYKPAIQNGAIGFRYVVLFKRKSNNGQ